MNHTQTDNDLNAMRSDPSFSEASNDDDDAILEQNDESTHRSGRSDGAKSQEIGKEETKAVWRLKLIVLAVLIVSAIAVSVSVYTYIEKNEGVRFQEEFKDDAAKLAYSVGLTMHKTMRAFDNVATTFVSFAHVTNQTWPFVTIPEYADQMVRILPLFDAIHMDLCPLVQPKKRTAWEKYTIHNDGWINQAMSLQANYDGYNGPIVYDSPPRKVIEDSYGIVSKNSTRPLFPIWQNFPVVPNETYTYNWDIMSILRLEEVTTLVEQQETVISVPYMVFKQDDDNAKRVAETLANKVRHFLQPGDDPYEPIIDMIYPVLERFHHTHAKNSSPEFANPKFVGLLRTSIYFRSMFRNILPPGSNGIHIVVENPCTDSFTYEIHGPHAIYLGVGDHHDKKYDYLRISSNLTNWEFDPERKSTYEHAMLNDDHCTLIFNVYPSDTMRNVFHTSTAAVFTACVLGVYIFTSLVFYVYDKSVEHRQRTVMETAVRSTAIVSSLFPSAVRDRLYAKKPEEKKSKLEATLPETAKGKLQSFLRDVKANTASTVSTTNSSGGPFEGSPIAELYPDTTVLFADIAGFTAWSSVRQPTQVLHLLESLYAMFDAIAKRRGVFKVETVGDSYVAVVGLPTPRKQHAVVMAIFANECRAAMSSLLKDLEKTLGPGTAELRMRFGLNSGPTTAGVLRGEKSRFQLFGDTVNTASRMESNGESNKIHISQKTADLIKQAGKGHWLIEREDEVHCKGKGYMKTFWCDPKIGTASAVSSDTSDMETDLERLSASPDSKMKLLVDWNVVLFADLLKRVVVAQRSSIKKCDQIEGQSKFGVPLDEVAEVISLPKARRNESRPKPKEVQLSDAVMQQLHMLISKIAGLYHTNPFHNFDHCSHVAMSTKKLLDRIVENGKEGSKDASGEAVNYRLITSDPLTHFAIVFAAMIHDVDHPGVSNAQLVDEQDPRAITYNGKSVAEQNSIDIAWNLLMEPQFVDLRNCIYCDEDEFQRFRQILVNVVMATDLFDKDLKAMRESRWIRSFETPNERKSSAGDDSNRRATIIIELIIQASDVSHTMQHFTVYKKWNMCLLAEIYNAYMNGRTTKNPLEGWYEGELWFFDNYVIPLAKKLRECGVFGVSCDEFLDYANDNRLEWETKGRDIVREAAAMLQASP